MRFPLESSIVKLTFTIASAVALFTYLWMAEQVFRADLLERQGKLEEAITVQPGNAQAIFKLGHQQLFTDANLQHAVGSLERSVALNPHASQSWLELAAAYQAQGDVARQSNAIRRALDADPTTPDVAWEAALFLATQGEVGEALRQLRVVSQHGDAASAVTLSLQLTQDVHRVLASAVAPTPGAHLALLNLLVAKHDVTGAAETWKALLNLNQVYDPRLIFPYLDFLIEMNEGKSAHEVWQHITQVNPKFSIYGSSSKNLVVNGGFEEEMQNGGLDWRYRPSSAALSLDTSVFRSGGRSLGIHYKGDANADAGVVEYIPVEANTEYELVAYTRAEQVYSANGPKLTISDAHSHLLLAASDELTGTFSWKPVSMVFTTTPQTSLLMLGITREPASSRIKGKLWLDDVSLAPK